MATAGCWALSFGGAGDGWTEVEMAARDVWPAQGGSGRGEPGARLSLQILFLISPPLIFFSSSSFLLFSSTVLSFSLLLLFSSTVLLFCSLLLSSSFLLFSFTPLFSSTVLIFSSLSLSYLLFYSLLFSALFLYWPSLLFSSLLLFSLLFFFFSFLSAICRPPIGSQCISHKLTRQAEQQPPLEIMC